MASADPSARCPDVTVGVACAGAGWCESSNVVEGPRAAIDVPALQTSPASRPATTSSGTGEASLAVIILSHPLSSLRHQPPQSDSLEQVSGRIATALGRDEQLTSSLPSHSIPAGSNTKLMTSMSHCVSPRPICSANARHRQSTRSSLLRTLPRSRSTRLRATRSRRFASHSPYSDPRDTYTGAGLFLDIIYIYTPRFRGGRN